MKAEHLELEEALRQENQVQVNGSRSWDEAQYGNSRFKRINADP